MCKFIGKSNEQVLCKLSKSEILRLYSIVHVAMETTKTSHFTCQSKSFIRIFYLPILSLWAGTFLLPWFGKWHLTHKLSKLCSATLKQSGSKKKHSPWITYGLMRKINKRNCLKKKAIIENNTRLVGNNTSKRGMKLAMLSNQPNVSVSCII